MGLASQAGSALPGGHGQGWPAGPQQLLCRLKQKPWKFPAAPSQAFGGKRPPCVRSLCMVGPEPGGQRVPPLSPQRWERLSIPFCSLPGWAAPNASCPPASRQGKAQTWDPRPRGFPLSPTLGHGTSQALHIPQWPPWNFCEAPRRGRGARDTAHCGPPASGMSSLRPRTVGLTA